MWRYLNQVTEPPKKKTKTSEERKETQREYDRLQRDRTFQNTWLTQFSWLVYDGEKKEMKCNVCINYDKTGSFITGCDNMKLKNIKRHDQSECHINNVKRQKASVAPGSSAANKAVKMLNCAAFSKLKLLFRNAHYIAKSGKPYSDFIYLCQLDIMKGIDVGTTYINDKYCAKFISAIAAVRKQEQDRIISEAPFMSVISDGATDSSCKEAEIVLVRSSFQCQVQTHFIAIRNVQKADSTHITEALSDALSERFGEAWKKTLVAMGTDGASVMLGCKTGVVQKMRELTKSQIYAIHCSAHRLELVYKDAVKKLPSKTHNKCEALLLNLYLFYKFSPLNRANLTESFKAMGISPKVPTRVGGTRWLPHTKLALKNFLHSYEAITQHLEQIQNPSDPSHRKDSAAKGKHFLSVMKSENTMFWMHFLLDVVVCLSMAPEAIQEENANLADIWNELETVKSTLKKFKSRY
ncbi:zinc finger protein 862-like [Ruditapes philippinarum]|uniref:zinc finger protein 862-like n=1 Tax=Ruditapes philippinarum TaxID=129788 RepID=UPI00295BFD43|nr:zinc finger protein 862-like [Ruditapes philippinarum]